MNVLIADKFSDDAIETLKKEGAEVVCNPELDGDTLVQAISEFNPQVLVVRSTKVQKPMLEASKNLALVLRAGAGVNTIDVPLATEMGIAVANCPGKNSIAVAELTMGLILAMDRRIPENVIDLRAGQWNKKLYSKARGIKGQTLGLVGVGNIGKAVIERAKAFEMNVIAWSRSLTDEKANELGIRRADSPLAVAKASDVVSVHVALTDDTKQLCNQEFFNAMQDGAFFINTSRSGVVDEAALIDAMEKRGIRAGLDLFEDEPSSKNCEWQTKLSAHTGVTGTHHIGASTEQAQTAIGDEALRVIQTYGKTKEVLNCVNPSCGCKSC